MSGDYIIKTFKDGYRDGRNMLGAMLADLDDE